MVACHVPSWAKAEVFKRDWGPGEPGKGVVLQSDRKAIPNSHLPPPPALTVNSGQVGNFHSSDWDSENPPWPQYSAPREGCNARIWRLSACSSLGWRKGSNEAQKDWGIARSGADEVGHMFPMPASCRLAQAELRQDRWGRDKEGSPLPSAHSRSQALHSACF